MAYPADFPDAHLRHWLDAERLWRDERWANADQLYGFSAECGLKAVMKDYCMPVDSLGKPTDLRHVKHIQQLWGVFFAFVGGRSTANLLHLLPQANPFGKWSPSDRYASGHHFQRDAVAPHRAAAQQVRRFYFRHKVDGRVQL